MAQRQVGNPRLSTSVVISTAGTSDILDLAGYRIAGITMSTAWTSAALSFLGGNTTAALFELYTSTAQVTISTGLIKPSRSFAPVADFAAALAAQRYVQLRSGTTAASTQAAARTIALTLLPVR